MKDPDVTDKFVCCPEIIINSEQMSDADVLGKFIYLFLFIFLVTQNLKSTPTDDECRHFG